MHIKQTRRISISLRDLSRTIDGEIDIDGGENFCYLRNSFHDLIIIKTQIYQQYGNQHSQAR